MGVIVMQAPRILLIGPLLTRPLPPLVAYRLYQCHNRHGGEINVDIPLCAPSVPIVSWVFESRTDYGKHL